MIQQNRRVFRGEPRSISIREHLSKYISKWPIFAILVFICVGLGMIYSRYTVPEYIAATSLLIKGADGRGSASGDLIESALNGKREINLSNEILALSSPRLMRQTVARNDFNISYFKRGKILDIDIYKDAPFVLSARALTDSGKTYKFYVKEIDSAGGIYTHGIEELDESHSFVWGSPISIDGQQFVLTPRGTIDRSDGEYIVQWQPIAVAANALSANLTVEPFDNKTSAIELSLRSENLQKGKDVLNALFAQFSLNDVMDRNRISDVTVQFIDERLMAISQELKAVEGNLENFQGSQRLVDVKSQSTQSLENTNTTSRTIKELAIQQRMIDIMFDFFADADNSDRLIPSVVGLVDPTLTALVNQYNELQLKREREAPVVAPNSTVMQNIKTDLRNLKGNIIESLNSLNKNLEVRKSNFRQQNEQAQGFLASLPRNERVLQEIKRKQSITEGLYLYLLQKREEAAISRTATDIVHYTQLDESTGYGPVKPNPKNITVYAGLLGIFLAFAWIYCHSLLNDKVSSAEEIINGTSLPLLGQVVHLSSRKKQVIPVLEVSLISEQFRAIRTNLSFSRKKQPQQTILVTSSVCGEGKSFVSLNLATVCAMSGKKVALLEFDLRRPSITPLLQLNPFAGLSDYLAGDIEDISGIIQQITDVPNMHLFPCGPIPKNPGDILVTERMDKLFEKLKGEYDYVIIDSPPSELVSDAFIFEEYSDLTLFVVRQGVTLKKHIDFITHAVKKYAISNAAIILNDTKPPAKSGYYDYSYTKKEPAHREKKFKVAG